MTTWTQAHHMGPIRSYGLNGRASHARSVRPYADSWSWILDFGILDSFSLPISPPEPKTNK